jgi:hypothetical protein
VVARIVGVISLLLLPLSVLLWHSSHAHPHHRRYDVTLFKSLRVHLKDGVCGLRLLSMPTKTASRSEFFAPLQISSTPNNSSLLFSSVKQGQYRVTWIVFPLWLSTAGLAVTGITPLAARPLRDWRRRRNGWCVYCGYDLTGNRSGRCPECGMRFRRPGRHRRYPRAYA